MTSVVDSCERWLIFGDYYENRMLSYDMSVGGSKTGFTQVERGPCFFGFIFLFAR